MPEVTSQTSLPQSNSMPLSTCRCSSKEPSRSLARDWPDEEHPPLPDATIGWLLRHIEFWWNNAADAAEGHPTQARAVGNPHPASAEHGTELAWTLQTQGERKLSTGRDTKRRRPFSIAHMDLHAR
jgi:hypothetical protein